VVNPETVTAQNRARNCLLVQCSRRGLLQSKITVRLRRCDSDHTIPHALTHPHLMYGLHSLTGGSRAVT
jgi:hypothetical protein